MKLPRATYRLPNGVVLEPQAIEAQSWQYHLLKHPLGFDRKANVKGKAPEDPEGWGVLNPPVVEAGWRAQIVARIAQLQVGPHQCALPEVWGKSAKIGLEQDYACWNCPRTLVKACGEVTAAPEHPVGPRYAQVTEEVAASLADGQLVPVGQVFQVVSRLSRRPDVLGQLCLLQVGRAPSDQKATIARATRGDGVIVDFKQEGAAWRWRSTYRAVVQGAAGPANLFLKPLQGVGNSLSENYVVARQWWEQHGK